MELLRSVTDEHVLRALVRHRRVTRAELATELGISKPTAGESIRRLTERGLVVDTGERTPGGRGKGRVGSYYALSPDVGTALAITIAPSGVVGERIDAYGDTVAQAARPVDRPASPPAVVAALKSILEETAGGGPARLAVVSAADPVDRATGRLVHLPDAPFLIGELDPIGVLAPYVGGPVIVDNDVNWAARAEGLSDAAYLFLGEGLGCAVVSDGSVLRGSAGLAGEIAHVVVTGPDGRATRFIEVFDRLGLRQAGSTAIAVDRLLATSSCWPLLGRAVADVVCAIVALADPSRIVLGGAWGPAPLDAIRAAVGQLARPLPVQASAVDGDPALAGVRIDALERLRASIAGAAALPCAAA